MLSPNQHWGETLTEACESHAVEEKVEEALVAGNPQSTSGSMCTRKNQLEAYLNMLVKSVYDRPDKGLWAKLRIITGPQRGTRQAIHTNTFTAPIAQQVRLPSVALSIGWNTCTYDQVIIAFIVSGNWSTDDLRLASPDWRC